MDPLDLAILRELCRDKHHWWGGVDPRVSTETVANRIDVAGSTVRARIALWERTGFLRGIDLMPNPSLFGASLRALKIRLADPAAKETLLEDLSWIPGARLALDHVGDRVYVLIAATDAEEHRRAASLIARLPGVAEVTGSESFHGPVATLAPSSVDWRILAELRREPRARVCDIARRARVSARTFTRRYDGLVRGNAMLHWLLLDFTRAPGVVGRMVVRASPGARREQLCRELRGSIPGAAELWSPTRNADEIDLFLHRENMPVMEEAERIARTTAGVASVELLYPRSLRAYPRWVDARLRDAGAGDHARGESLSATLPRAG